EFVARELLEPDRGGGAGGGSRSGDEDVPAFACVETVHDGQTRVAGLGDPAQTVQLSARVRVAVSERLARAEPAGGDAGHRALRPRSSVAIVGADRIDHACTPAR